MVRLRKVATGAVVNVTEEKAALLGSEWEIVADEKPARITSTKPASK